MGDGLRRLVDIKKELKTKCPCGYGISRVLFRTVRNHRSRKSVFTDRFRNNGFAGRESISGRGSDLVQTEIIRKEIPLLVQEVDAKSFLDAPCGDFFWMKETELGVAKYTGVDIVPDLIEQNRKQYGNETREFMVLDIVKDRVPRADIILCRDCLVHLSHKDIRSVLRNFKRSGSTYILTTTFTGCHENKDVSPVGWRPINLQRPPYNFRKPLKQINENCTLDGGKHTDKCLGLWKLDSIDL